MVAMADGALLVENQAGDEIVKSGVKPEILSRPDSRDSSSVDLEEEQEEEEEIKEAEISSSISPQIDDAGSALAVAATSSEAVKSTVDLEQKEETAEVGGGESAPAPAPPVGVVEFIHPHEKLPQPEPPKGVTESSEDGDDSRPMNLNRSESLSVDVPAIGKFLKDRSTSIANRLSSTFKDSGKPSVTEISLSGLKVIVKSKDGEDDDVTSQIKGRISFFSRSNCRDCRAVRTFFREKGLKFVEINVDVFPNREKELIHRTGTSTVPQIFINEKLLGGLVALNSLRNCGQFQERMREMLARKCPDEAPAAPVYGFDDDDSGGGGVEEEKMDEMIGIVRVLRQKLPIQDRLMKMKIVKNCFAGSELVEVIIHHMDCGRKKAVEISKLLVQKHFIHHVFGKNEFEDGNQFYRFLEHEPYIPKCYNFRGTNDCEPKSAAAVGQRLGKIMSAILESYASEDRRHLDYMSITTSEEFRRYTNLVQDLQRVDMQSLSSNEKLAFFLNLYNAMVIHAVIRIGHPGGLIDRRTFFSDFLYLVGGYSYSLSEIENGILRNNRKPPYSWIRHFSNGDQRLQLALPKVNPLVHFGLCNGTNSSPTVRFFSAQAVESELRAAAREFLQYNGIEIDLAKRTVHLSRIINWFSSDFGSEKEILEWILNFLDATKVGHLTHLLNDGESVRISYQSYDWSPNT